MRRWRFLRTDYFLGFDPDVADASDEIVGRRLALFHGQNFDGISLVMGTQNQVSASGFDIFHGATSVLQSRVHIEFALAIGLKRVVVTVDKERGPGQKARVHAHALAGVGLDEHEALPLLAIALEFRFQFFEKALLEFEDFLDVHAGKKGMGGSDGPVGEEDVLEFVVAGRHNRSALVDLGRVKQVEDREVLNRQHPIHALEAESTLTIQEV